MCVKGLYFLTVLSGLAASGVLQVSGMRIYTSGDVEAVNGTDVRLKCTFQSSSPINPSSIVISWTFRPLKPGREESVFHYQQRAYPPVDGIFRKRVSWAGDIMGRDASIILQQVKFTYNGTYICQVKNPPDVHGAVGEIRLRVVTTGGARKDRDRGSWKGTRRLPAKREKTPLRGKTKREAEGEEVGDRERNRRITHFLSRSPSNSGDRVMWRSFLGPGAFFLLDASLLPSPATTVFGSQIWTS
ncbi:myelin protein zero-like protein 2 isoform X2 [Chaetodon auriga]|uniref:myelin protein zero-like protein 2 isoform X2 n=1 Tax=Chaetodon auriga TaxID=39042 RepID=UPI004032FEFA